MIFPKVSESLIKALKDLYKPLPPMRGESYEDMLIRAGQQEVISFLEGKSKE